MSRLLLDDIKASGAGSELRNAIIQTTDFMIHLSNNISTDIYSQRQRYWEALSAAVTTNLDHGNITCEFGYISEDEDDILSDQELLDIALVGAACARDTDLIQSLLGKGADIDTQNENFGNPLYISVAQHIEESVVLLLENRAMILAHEESLRTALHEAAIQGAGNLLRMLIRQEDADLNCRDYDGRTPLSFAAEEGYLDIVQVLADHDSTELDDKDAGGRTPLNYAVLSGHTEVVRFLLSSPDINPEIRDNESNTPIIHAAELGHRDVVECLANCDAVVADRRGDNGRTALSYAAEAGREAVVDYLLKRGDVVADKADYARRTPLSYAAKKGHAAIVKLLLDRDDVEPINLDYNSGWTPLVHAIYNCHDETVELLLNRDTTFIPEMLNPPWPVLARTSEGIRNRLITEYEKITGRVWGEG
ncbi:hypothetical protein FQN54_002624 [Arachnomyces sp. PD_36]|nr:hypothetical protein FQN54_002624 [Arachnomyces sp. PD_36]